MISHLDITMDSFWFVLDSAVVRINVVFINKKTPDAQHSKCVHEIELSSYFIHFFQAYLLIQRTGGPNAKSYPPREHCHRLVLTSVFFNNVFILHNNLTNLSVSNSYFCTDHLHLCWCWLSFQTCDHCCRLLLQAVHLVPCTLSNCDFVFILSLLPQLLDKKLHTFFLC